MNKGLQEFYLTEEQIQKMEHFERMFEYNADKINDLCGDESPDIVYGFELGKIHSHLIKCFDEMETFIIDIKKQTIENEK